MLSLCRVDISISEKTCMGYALIATKRSDWLHLIHVIWPKYVMLDRPDPYFSKGTAAPDYKWIIFNRIVKFFYQFTIIVVSNTDRFQSRELYDLPFEISNLHIE